MIEAMSPVGLHNRLRSRQKIPFGDLIRRNRSGGTRHEKKGASRLHEDERSSCPSCVSSAAPARVRRTTMVPCGAATSEVCASGGLCAWQATIHNHQHARTP